jgi:muconolactone delta-isomerase
MKYLVTVASRIGTQVPKVADPDRLMAEAQAWNASRIQDGTFESAYGFASGRGGIAIVNSATHSDLMRTLRASPMFHYVDYDVEPLCAMEEYYAIHREALGAAR